METTRFRSISRNTFFLRVLRDVKVNKESETCSYVKLGVRKTISGEKYRYLAHIVFRNSIADTDNRMAMAIRCKATGKKFIVIDRAFYDEF
jgi:hypothetical protein